MNRGLESIHEIKLEIDNAHLRYDLSFVTFMAVIFRLLSHCFDLDFLDFLIIYTDASNTYNIQL